MRRALAAIAAALLALIALATAAAAWQGAQTPAGRPEYVALGSSFAAGAGLGRLQPGSPLLCARSVNGYPEQLARRRRLSIVDMSCGGAVTRNLLYGGQFFQGPQLRTIGAATRLVTITVGGNDVGYIGDLSLSAMRNARTPAGSIVRLLWSGPKPLGARGFDRLRTNLIDTLQAIHRRAPGATVVLVTYPTIVPAVGTCATLGLTAAQADAMRKVGDMLAASTRSAAQSGSALIVDMHQLGAAHDACSSAPWTRGLTNGGAAPFHPTALGARASAEAISGVISDRE